ncbi:MAG TPA: hypothetical protein VHM90_06935 [Phycisphaerae bacterium]|nr:hypothetical protein [Phycisphaerae bacterium]
MVPTGVKVVSILGIILAALTLLAMPCGIFMTFHPMQPNPTMDALIREPSYVVMMVVSTIIRTILSLMLLIGSIASLKLKPMGRHLMNGYAVALIVYAIVSTAFSYAFVMPKMLAALQNDPRIDPTALSVARISGVIGGVIGLAFYGAIAGVILYFFSRPVAKDAFNGIVVAAPANVPVDPAPPDSPVY